MTTGPGVHSGRRASRRLCVTLARVCVVSKRSGRQRILACVWLTRQDWPVWLSDSATYDTRIGLLPFFLVKLAS